MSHFSVQRYLPSHKKLWDDFVAQAKNATFLFYRDFMEYHQERFDDYSLLVFKDEKIVALLPANRVDNSIHSHQGLTYGGLVLDEKVKLKEVSQLFRDLLKFLNSESIEELHIKIPPSIYNKMPSDELDYLLFITKAELTRKDTLSVITYDNLPKSISEIRKRGIKKAIANNLVVKEETNFPIFWNTILTPNLDLQHKVKPVHSLEEISNLKANFSNNIRQFNVYKEDKLVAGTTIFETDTVAHAQYISANDQRQEFGSLDFLFNHLIHSVFKNKRYFDFGISNENQGKTINEGLLYWKESFGARSITQDFYTVDVANYKFIDTIWL